MIERKTVLISLNLNGAGNAERDIRIDGVNFLPDEIILRSVSSATGAVGGNMMMWSNLVGDILFTQSLGANTGSNQSYEIHFPNHQRNVQGSFIFRALDADGALLNAANTFRVMFQLEFVKYS